MSPAPLGNQNSVGHGPGPGNRNRERHQLRGPLTIGRLKQSYARKLAGLFLRTAEAAALEVHGTIGLYEQGRLNTATKHEIKGLLATRWLRLEGDGLPVADRLKLLDAICNASEARDKALKDLGLDAKPGSDPWAAVDALPPIEPAGQTSTNGGIGDG